MTESLEKRLRKKLPPNETRINELLKDKLIQHELLETMQIATFARRPGLRTFLVTDGEVIKDSPPFKLIAEFQTALYSHERKAVYVGDWNIPHSSIAKKENLQAMDELGLLEESDTGDYTSADVFVLVAAKDVKVMILDTLFGLNKGDIVAIRRLGYFVLDPDGNWLFEGPNNIGIIKIPSSFSSD